MNTPILRKCLEELSKENPRLDYVRGILETLIDSQPLLQTTPNGIQTVPWTSQAISSTVVDPGLPPMPDINKIAGIVQQSQ